MSKELNINLRLSREQAKRDADAFKRDMSALNRDLARDATAAAKQGSESTVNLWRDAHGRLRQENGRFATDAQKAAYAAEQGFGKAAFAVGGMVTAVKLALDTVRGFAAALDQVGAKAREISDRFTGQRDSLRELAQLRGTQASGQFAVTVAREARDAGQTLEEARQFQLQFYNAGAQYKDRTGAEAFEKIRSQAARYVTAKGIEQGVGGDIAGTFLGFRDYGKLPEGQRAGAFAGDLNASFDILQAGKGETSVLARQLAIAGSASLNEDALRGTFQNPADLATAISVAAESNPAEAAYSIRAASRGLRDFNDKKAGPLLKRAGITPQTPFLEAVRKLNTEVSAEAKRDNVPLQDVLGRYFEDSLTREALATQMNRGVAGGLYDQRAAVGRASGTAEAANRVVDDFLGTTTGRERVAAGDVALADAEKALKSEDLTVLRKQALANLKRAGEIDTNATAINDYLAGTATFGMIGSAEQKRIDDEVQRMAVARAGAQGLNLQRDFLGGAFNFSPEARQDELNRMLGQFRAAGKDPLAAAGDEVNGLDRTPAGPLSSLLKPEVARPRSLPNLDMPAAPAPQPLVPRPEVKNR